MSKTNTHTNSSNNSDTSNTFQSSYNDLASEIDSTQTPSITFGSTEISVSDIPSTSSNIPKKKKFFNFKFVEPDTSYETQESSEQKQFIKDEEDARRSEEDTESEIITEQQTDEAIEDSTISMPSLEIPDLETDTEIDTSMIVDIEPDTDIDDTEYQEAVNLFDVEKPDLPDLPEMPYLEMEAEEPEETPMPTIKPEPTEAPIPDPDAGLTWYQKWKRQVFLVRRDSGVDINKDILIDSREASIRDLANSYTQSNQKVSTGVDTNKNVISYSRKDGLDDLKKSLQEFQNRKDDKNINGIDTLIGFFTILFDKIGEILSSVLSFSKKSLKYKKGDKRWVNGIGRIFVIFVMGVILYKIITTIL
jgi:hypothetical protein